MTLPIDMIEERKLFVAFRAKHRAEFNRDPAQFEAWLAGRASLLALLQEQQHTIKSLNFAIGGEGSLTTDNLRKCGNLPLLEEIKNLQSSNPSN